MRTVQALTAVGALTLALTACGNGGDSAAPNATIATSSAPTASASSSAPSTSASASSDAGSAAASASGSPASTAAPSTPASTAAPTTPPASGSNSATASPTGSASASGGPVVTKSASSAPSKSGTATAYAYSYSGWSQFTTPTGRNWCDMTDGEVGCSIPPALSAKHGGSGYISLSPKGYGYLIGDPGWDPEGKIPSKWTTSVPNAPVSKKGGTAVLSYGSSFTSGGTTCKSSVTGITCSNSVASFTVNSAGVTVSGQRDTTKQS